MIIGFEEGFKRIEALGAPGALDQYFRSSAARRDILRRMNRFREAAEARRRALGGGDSLDRAGIPEPMRGDRRANLCFRLIATKILPALRVLFAKEGKR